MLKGINLTYFGLCLDWAWIGLGRAWNGQAQDWIWTDLDVKN